MPHRRSRLAYIIVPAGHEPDSTGQPGAGTRLGDNAGAGGCAGSRKSCQDSVEPKAGNFTSLAQHRAREI